MAWGRRAEGPAGGLAEGRDCRHGKLRVRLRVMPRCQGRGAAARWTHGPLPASPPARARLRHRPTLASCRTGGHAIWWTVDADSEEDALALLPFYVAKRTTITPVSEVQIP
jgi:hypothetical protein